MTPPEVFGVRLDAQTRCAHWHSELDVVAMRFKCCGRFYGCRSCHDETADHPAELWSTATDPHEVVALCGVCLTRYTLRDYLPTTDRCPACRAPWNPGCTNHRHLYFNVE